MSSDSTEAAAGSAVRNWFLSVGLASSAGVRPENQDRVAHFASPFGHVMVLADGMGGHRGGAVAASMAVAKLPSMLEELPADTPPEEALRASIRAVSTAIRKEANAENGGVRGMGSTLVTLLIRSTTNGPMAIGAHVGDSRLYFLRGGRLFRMTSDHTVVERLIGIGALTEQDAQQHPQAGVLTRALGCEEAVEADLTPWSLLQPDDSFVLCSDGLSGYVREQSIEETLLVEREPQSAADELVALALREGSRDNVTVLVCRIEQAPAPPGV